MPARKADGAGPPVTGIAEDSVTGGRPERTRCVTRVTDSLWLGTCIGRRQAFGAMANQCAAAVRPAGVPFGSSAGPFV